MDVDLPAEDDPRRVEVRAWFTAHPTPTPAELVDAGYVVPHWPAPVRSRRRARAPAHHRGRDAARGRDQAGQPDRHRSLRPDPRRARERRAEAAVPDADADRRRAVVPAVQRARRGLRSREPQHARRARRRHLPRERSEDLDVARRARQVRHPHRARAATSRSTAASRTSSSRWTCPVSRCARSGR